MAEPHLLIDNDLFVLLAGANLLDAALEVFGFDRSRVEILPALPHMVRKGKRFQQLKSTGLQDLVLAACATVKTVASPAIEIQERLSACTDVDPGEVVLFGRLVESATMLLASGDRRAILVVGANPSIRDLRSSIIGRVACLEIVLQRLVRQFGAERIAEAFQVFPDHKSLQIFFSPLNSTNQEACLASIDSYLRDLNRTVGDDFFIRP